jgi:hypothetical protein
LREEDFLGIRDRNRSTGNLDQFGFSLSRHLPNISLRQ